MSGRNGVMALAEMREFASFPKRSQRYIRCSLDIGFGSRDALRLWARDADEKEAMLHQVGLYRKLDGIKAAIPDDHDVERAEALMAPLVTLTAFDLGSGKLDRFGAYRFLYERLLGAAIRPWLPAAFCGAAALPHLHPDERRVLLHSITDSSATAPGWSIREPVFFPQWVDKSDRVEA